MSILRHTVFSTPQNLGGGFFIIVICLLQGDLYGIYRIKQPANKHYKHSPYTDKIEIGLNYGINIPDGEKEPVVRKISTETYETTRLFKGGTVKTTYRNYDVYVVV